MASYKFFICLLFVMSASAGAYAAGSVYSVHLLYDSGNLSLVEMHLTEGFPDPEDTDGPFECRLVSASGAVIQMWKFSPPTDFCFDEIDSATGVLKGGCTTLDRTEFLLSIPYSLEAGRMDFYGSNDVLILSAGLSGYGSPQKSNSSGESFQNTRVESDNTGGEMKDYTYPALFLLGILFAGFLAYRRMKK
jgi:hypothetical protein